MSDSIKEALKHLNIVWQWFEYKGKGMSKEQVRKILQFGLKKGYQNTWQITDNDIDSILNETF